MLLFILHNYLVFLPLCILVFFIIYFYVKRHKENKITSNYFKEEFKKIRPQEAYKQKVDLKETLKPKDFNDIQRMTKHNKNTYRDSKGRYASLK